MERTLLSNPYSLDDMPQLCNPPRLWVFNPGHEEALRIPSHLRYTPAKEVRQMRHDLAPLLSLLAHEGDYIYRPASPLGSPAELLDCRGQSVSPHPLRGSMLQLQLWGIEPHIIHELMTAPLLRGIDLVPPPISTDYLRMAHRRSCEGLLRYLIKEGGYPEALLPRWVEQGEDLSETKRLLREALRGVAQGYGSPTEVMVKRPFSSSGRGVLPFPRCYRERHLEALAGSCLRLGAVSIEPLWQVIENWALEYVRDGEGRVSFVAFSLFETIASGRAYAGNILQSQETLRARLIQHIGSEALTQLIALQETYLSEALVASQYEGYIGIDLFLYEDGGQTKLHPAVEINLRTTMGLLAHLAYERYLTPPEEGRFLIEYLPTAQLQSPTSLTFSLTEVSPTTLFQARITKA